MALTVDEIFGRMNELFLPDRAQGVDAAVSYHVTGEGGGDYTTVIKDSTFTLLKELRTDASATVTIAAEDWIALNEGRLDPVTAFVSGKLKIAGDQGLVQKFAKYFKRPTGGGSGIPLAELVPGRLAVLGASLRVVVKDQTWGDGPELKGDEAAVRGLVEGMVEPGPALLGGQLAFAGDMALLRQAWTRWSAEPVKPRRPKKPGFFKLLGMWIKAKLGG